MIGVNRKTAEYGIVFLIGVFLVLQIIGMSLEPNVSQNYVSFYFRLSVVGLIIVLGMAGFGFYYLTINPFKISLKVKLAIIGI